MTEEEPKAKRVKLSSSEKETRNKLLKKLKENGDFDSLKSTFYAQLMLQNSWREEMKIKMREAAQSSGGASEMTLDELAAALSSSKAKIPNNIQEGLREKIRSSIGDTRRA